MSEFEPLTNQASLRRRSMRPTRRTWIKHSALLLITFLTCTIAGVIQPFGMLQILPELESMGNDAGLIEVLLAIPGAYFNLVQAAISSLTSDLTFLSYGVKFSLSLLFILIAHECGHYIACRIYGVDATLPYFIPAPPLVGPAGTVGAFIKIVSPMPSRKAVFDIGVAGPIAGFVALLFIAVFTILTLENAPAAPPDPNEFQITFSDPILMRVFAWFAGIDLSQPIYPNPFYFATWVGLLITALNLIPSGQLDGGHAIYAVFGEKVHLWTGRIAFIAMTLFSLLGIYFFSSPSGLLIALLLGVMMKIRHPVPLDVSPLNSGRKAVAIVTLVIFVLCFVPIPIQLN